MRIRTVSGYVEQNSTQAIAWQEPLPGQELPLPVRVDPARRTAVFGTEEPARGLPELVRSWAYRYPDYDAQRWLLLLVADRIASGGVVAKEMVVPGEQPLVVRHFARQAQAHSVGGAFTIGTLLALGGAIWLATRGSADRPKTWREWIQRILNPLEGRRYIRV